MSRLTAALEQFDKAVDRLEAAVESSSGRRANGRQDALSTELNGLRSSHATLQAEARSVSARLDAAIGRLRAAMEV